MQYQKVKDLNGNVRTDMVVRIDDNNLVSFIPNDPNNRDWAAYQAWLAEGNTPQAAS